MVPMHSSDSSSWAWHMGERSSTMTGWLGTGGLGGTVSSLLHMEHSSLGGDWISEMEDEGGAGLAWQIWEAAVCKCSWKWSWVTCTVVTAEAMRSLFSYSIRPTVSSFPVHSCSACHKNSFGSCYWPVEQSTNTFCSSFIKQWQSFQMSPSVFLRVFIRPVWFLRQVGWQRGSWPLLCPGTFHYCRDSVLPGDPKWNIVAATVSPHADIFQNKYRNYNEKKKMLFLCDEQIIRLLWGLDKNKPSVTIISYCFDWVNLL